MGDLSGQDRAMNQKRQFYRRVLPATCVDFASDHGRRLFVDALAEGNMNIYFKLAAQYLTQEEPSFCGLSSLVMVLNALEVDPARVWKGAWRWYHEAMLDCCLPLDRVQEIGINVEQFECLAKCNRLEVKKYVPPPAFEQIPDESLRREVDEFRKRVVESVRSSEVISVASYSRRSFGQTGDGHFSPLAGYNSKEDKVLIMDVARFKYPPHWVSVHELWQSIRQIDSTTGRPRAYFELSLDRRLKPMLLLRLSNASLLEKVVDEVHGLFLDNCSIVDEYTTDDAGTTAMVDVFVEKMWQVLKNFDVIELRNVNSETIELDNTCCNKCISVAHQHVKILIKELVEALENTAPYLHLKAVHPELNQDQALLTVGLFLAWPFETVKSCPLTEKFATYCSLITDKLPTTGWNEIVSLKSQISAVLCS